MLYFKSAREAFTVFDAMGSEIRLQVVELLLQYKIMNMDSIAKKLHLSNGGLTPHMKKLEQAGIIKVTLVAGSRGVQKQCSLCIDKLVIDFSDNAIDQTHTLELDVGQFDRCNFISSPCGLGTSTGLIGVPDSPKYFEYPQRFNASVLWFSGGSIEYRIPCALKEGQRMSELQIYFEINSFDKSTEIFFEINSVRLGMWTAPDRFTDRDGFFTPKWMDGGSYGILKALTINKKGSFINDLPIGNLTIDDLLLTPEQSFIFRIVAPKQSDGICLFGKGFGDYDLGIKISQIGSI